MATAIDEIEHKYEAPPGAVLPRLEDLPKVAAESGPDQQNLEAEKWLSGVLGAPRDAEVLAARLQRHLRETPAELVMGAVTERIRLHFAPLEAQGRQASPLCDRGGHPGR
ncbi:MAG: CHAD domain-containing protein [Streptosporangiaceae bacterium]